MSKINYLKVRNSKCRAKPYRGDKKQKVYFYIVLSSIICKEIMQRCVGDG